jgi:hypothetical protein
LVPWISASDLPDELALDEELDAPPPAELELALELLELELEPQPAMTTRTAIAANSAAVGLVRCISPPSFAAADTDAVCLDRPIIGEISRAAGADRSRRR